MSLTIHSAPNLIEYAADERPAVRPGMSASTMFSMGYDTLEIANHLGISEALAHRRINIARSARNGHPTPYRKGEP